MVDATDETGESLMRLLPPLRRAIVQAVRAAEGLPNLPEAQVLMLRTLETAGPVTPGQLADELHLARPTVSNLVRELVGNGLLDRKPSEQDGRSVRLELTDRARGLLEAFNRGRHQVLTEALRSLPDGDRANIAAAVPSLGLLRKQLQRMGADDE
ncbi:MarR family winged helix-turn-helix transcriptional regulator [Saccharopolyspora griseoalba]|uniref:MarR family winged helix-turn-helix transcriptional regulator n=1 Tax=Saccharopolyspora griseoalba TaxID=1431848 RepID=A0ABW2LDM3_9PSEU